MLNYFSNTNENEIVDFKTAILKGFANDGGLFVPEHIPQIENEKLISWQNLNYRELAFEVIRLFVDEELINHQDLMNILNEAYTPFEHHANIPIRSLSNYSEIYLAELFHGPSLSFKDFGQAFLINLFDHFLKKDNKKKNLLLATTGDTGPAAAFFAEGKPTLNAFVLYPDGMITPEQKIQMTSLARQNIYPINVFNCNDGGDDLDLIIASIFGQKEFINKFNVSSVNSINWGRILIQSVHYFYTYLQVADEIGEKINFSVPSGAFGNLCAGYLAKRMGLPVNKFIIANNENNCLERIFTKGHFLKNPIYKSISSAIDILIPYNFWRFLYFVLEDSSAINIYKQEFDRTGDLKFKQSDFEKYSKGFLTHSINNKETFKIIEDVFYKENYLFDPHGAVAFGGVRKHIPEINHEKTICLLTAHPAKFPGIYKGIIPDSNKSLFTHSSIEMAKQKPVNEFNFSLQNLETDLKSLIIKAN